MLQEDDDEVRWHALLALSAMKQGEAASAAPALERALLNEKSELHLTLAIAAIQKADRQAAVQAFMAVLEKTRNLKSRTLAAAALGYLGPDAQAAVETLHRVLDEPDSEVRRPAAEALWHIGRPTDAAMLLTFARCKIEVWQEIIPEAQHAVPGLLEALRNPDAEVRRQATIALGYLGQIGTGRQIARALGARVKDESPEVRSGAANALGTLGPNAQEAIPGLIEALQDSDPETRSSAALALGLIRLSLDLVVPALIKALEDHDVHARSYAAIALGRIGPGAKDAVPALIKALDDKEEYMRTSAAMALGKIGPAAQAAVPSLIKGLQDESFSVRREAAYGLGKIGPDAKAAVPALTKALSENGIHYVAADALEKINRPKANKAEPP
jgi:HEAT repeat protein